MERVLIFIKHHFAFLWKIIDGINGQLFSWLYKSKLGKALPEIFQRHNTKTIICRKLTRDDIQPLHVLIESQPSRDLEYFSPHNFDLLSLKSQLRKPAFLMMGVFENKKMIGYFFLRFFANKKCFVGRLIDKEYRGKGIGQVMNNIMYETAWEMDFRCLSTISKNNTAVMKAHAKNNTMIVLKQLQNNYLLVEFVRKN